MISGSDLAVLIWRAAYLGCAPRLMMMPQSNRARSIDS
jgi:hypothetical protein